MEFDLSLYHCQHQLKPKSVGKENQSSLLSLHVSEKEEQCFHSSSSWLKCNVSEKKRAMFPLSETENLR